MARPSVRVAGHGLATSKGAVGCGQGPMHRRWSVAANPQERQPSTGTITCSVMPVRATSPQGRQPPASTTAYSAAPARAANPQGVAASRVSDAGRKGGRRLAGRLPANKGSCRLCKGGDDTVGVWTRVLDEVKSKTFEKFREYKNEVENQIEKSIKTLRSDRGGEYLSMEFTHFLKDNRILSQWTPPYTPQVNGISKMRNHTLLNMM
ncbi:hypothetical protein OPV22_000980 [Ensete ventricosum]|uniref:Integrase catalytic domain-containing protein n=1 Tax=Ensete ventricosum TaxID=4639 RepID=A0AAV8QB02_ENSVE|nr:hypothetical protein OPV22_000980 [Ensete ventricosum]